MEKLGQAGNTYYIFDSNGDGVSFTNLGRFVSKVKLSNVSLFLRSIKEVNVLSILGMSGVNRSDVFFNGASGVSNIGYMELIKKAKTLSNMGFIPFRIQREEEPGLMQVLFIIRPGTVSKEKVRELLHVACWRE